MCPRLFFSGGNSVRLVTCLNPEKKTRPHSYARARTSVRGRLLKNDFRNIPAGVFSVQCIVFFLLFLVVLPERDRGLFPSDFLIYSQCGSRALGGLPFRDPKINTLLYHSRFHPRSPVLLVPSLSPLCLVVPCRTRSRNTPGGALVNFVKHLSASN